MRNRYLDLLRAAAIVRVVFYHLFGWPWLSILLPAMGIMFALAGSLTAASLDKRSAGRVITSRLRRLLPPLWLLAVIAVPAMLYLGWSGQDGGDRPFTWKLGLWLLPIGDPPGSQRGLDVWEPLWYVRAYLWFVVLSPVMYLVYRKIGWAAVAAPIVLIAVLDKTGFEMPFGRADTAMWDFATYGACWMAGFAHHDGRLGRLRPSVVAAISAVLGLAALYWLRGHGEGTYDLNDVSESQALWSLAFVLLALRWQPDMTWLARNPRLDGAVNLLNNRAVTIYLWHNIAIAAIWPILTVLTLDDLGDLDGPTDLVASLGLTVLAVLTFGWVEDLAAKRKPALWPTGIGKARDRGPDKPSSSVPGSVLAAASAPGTYPPGSPAPTGNRRPDGTRSSEIDPDAAGDRTPSSDPDSAASPDRAGAHQPTGAPGPAGTRRLPGDSGPAGASDPAGPHQPTGAFPLIGRAPQTLADLPGTPVQRRAAPSLDGYAPAGSPRMAPWSAAKDDGTAPRQDRIAPFPEAAVSFGLPDAGRSFGPRDGDRGRSPGQENSSGRNHLSGRDQEKDGPGQDIEDAGHSPSRDHEDGGRDAGRSHEGARRDLSRSHEEAGRDLSRSHEEAGQIASPDGTGAGVDGSKAPSDPPAPAQSRGEEPATAVPWFGKGGERPS